MAKLFIGTSGWNYDHWRTLFYPGTLDRSRWLEFYSARFTTVELNVTFYHTPQETTIKNWLSKTPRSFVFSAKMNRFITHIKRLNDVEEPLVNFDAMVSRFGKKLGVILIQLPPSLRFDPERGEHFFRLLREKGKDHKYAIECRNKTWFSDEAYELLRRYEIALCMADSGGRYPRAEVITAPFTYLRFHGPGSLYSSKYDESHLHAVAEKVLLWRQEHRLDVYVYFNNDFHGYAVENALKLIELTS